MLKPRPQRVRHTGMRVAAGMVLLVTVGCGGQRSTTLGASTTATPGAVPSAIRSSSATANATSASGTTTAQATVGAGQATVIGTMNPGTVEPSSPAATIRPTDETTVVTDGANGTTVYLHTGQRLSVHLDQGTYDPPGSSSNVLVRRSSSGGYPTDQPVRAVFEAVARGTADVTTNTDAACFHTEPRCMMPTRMWVVHVTVT